MDPVRAMKLQRNGVETYKRWIAELEDIDAKYEGRDA